MDKKLICDFRAELIDAADKTRTALYTVKDVWDSDAGRSFVELLKRFDGDNLKSLEFAAEKLCSSLEKVTK